MILPNLVLLLNCCTELELIQSKGSKKEQAVQMTACSLTLFGDYKGVILFALLQQHVPPIYQTVGFDDVLVIADFPLVK